MVQRQQNNHANSPILTQKGTMAVALATASALALFSATRVGADASALLAQPESPPRWWEPGVTGRRKMHIRIQPRVFQVTSTALSLPGEQDRLCVVAFLPVARAETLDNPTLGALLPGASLPRTR